MHPFTNISYFTIVFLVTFETSGSPLEFRINFCGFWTLNEYGVILLYYIVSTVTLSKIVLSIFGLCSIVFFIVYLSLLSLLFMVNGQRFYVVRLGCFSVGQMDCKSYPASSCGEWPLNSNVVSIQAVASTSQQQSWTTRWFWHSGQTGLLHLLCLSGDAHWPIFPIHNHWRKSSCNSVDTFFRVSQNLRNHFF